MIKKYKIIAIILSSLITCLIAGGAGGSSSRLNFQETKKILIKDPSSYQVDYKKVFEENAEQRNMMKKQAMTQLSAGLMAYNDGLYSIAAKHLEPCRENKYVRDLLRDNFHVSIEQIIERCGDVGCPQCLGSAKVDCTKCSGSGWILCRRCKGIGIVISSDFEEIVSRTNRKNITCVQCNGLTAVKCDNCEGSGQKNCPELTGFERGANKMLYDPVSDDIKRLLAISTYLVNGGTDIYSGLELEKSVTIDD